jgi:hypothetical protein
MSAHARVITATSKAFSLRAVAGLSLRAIVSLQPEPKYCRYVGATGTTQQRKIGTYDK